jgi:hypothetical protein
MRKLTIIANTIPHGTSKDQLPPSIAIDFVRYYDRRVNVPKEEPDACDVDQSVKKQTTLNLLNGECSLYPYVRLLGLPYDSIFQSQDF